MAQIDRDNLVTFVNNAREILASFVERSRELLPRHLREPCILAWPETDKPFSDLRNALRRDATPTDTLDAQLDQVGLTGASLNFKLSGFDAARQNRPSQDITALKRWFGKVFKWMNIVLGSLAIIFKSAELIKEFKECAEQGNDDSNEEWQRSVQR